MLYYLQHRQWDRQCSTGDLTRTPACVYFPDITPVPDFTGEWLRRLAYLLKGHKNGHNTRRLRYADRHSSDTCRD